MPVFLVAHKSGAHRIAAIALYRALLSQCRALKLEAPRSEELQNIVRNRFKQVRYLHSYRRLRVAFQAGYEAIDHLDAAVAGDEQSRSYVLDLLTRAPESVKRSPVRKLTKTEQKKVDRAEREALRESQEDAPPRVSLFERPLPLEKLSGRRHVPVLVDANHIPMLRLKKPQPRVLSQYLASRIKTRQDRHDRRHRLETELQLAKQEDLWDEILAENCGLKEDESGTWRDRWTAEISSALRDVGKLLTEEREKNRAMAEKMQAVVDREQALLEEEREERKAKKAAERREKADNAVEERKELLAAFRPPA